MKRAQMLNTQVSMGPGAKILLEEKATDGKLYAVCPIETYPGLAIQSVADSSRFKLLILVNLQIVFHVLLSSGILWSKWWRGERQPTWASASPTVPTALTWTPPSTTTSRGSRWPFYVNNGFYCFQVEAKLEQEAEEPHVPLDLAFKQGETIKVCIHAKGG